MTYAYNMYAKDWYIPGISEMPVEMLVLYYFKLLGKFLAMGKILLI